MTERPMTRPQRLEHAFPDRNQLWACYPEMPGSYSSFGSHKLRVRVTIPVKGEDMELEDELDLDYFFERGTMKGTVPNWYFYWGQIAKEANVWPQASGANPLTVNWSSQKPRRGSIITLGICTTKWKTDDTLSSVIDIYDYFGEPNFRIVTLQRRCSMSWRTMNHILSPMAKADGITLLTGRGHWTRMRTAGRIHLKKHIAPEVEATMTTKIGRRPPKLLGEHECQHTERRIGPNTARTGR